MMSAKAKAPDVGQVIELLRRVSFFQGLAREDLERIARQVRGRRFGAGELVFHEGDPGDKFFVVVAGAVEVLKSRPRGEPDRLAVRRAGEAVGEMSLLTDAPRSASVRALEPTDLLFVTREQFRALLGGDSLAVRLLRSLSRALSALNVRFATRGVAQVGSWREFSRTVQRSLLPGHTPSVPGYDIAGGVTSDDDGPGRTLWDAMPLAGVGTLLTVLDVRGEGLPSGFLLGIARAALREIARVERDVGRMLTRLNEAFAESRFEGVDEYVNVALVGLTADGAVWSGARKQPILVVRTDGGEVEELPPHGPPLGILPWFEFDATPIALEPGDALLALSGLDPGVLRGAGELVRRRTPRTAGQTVDLLRRAFERVDAGRTGGEATVLVVNKR